jgi:hypothetical protein
MRACAKPRDGAHDDRTRPSRALSRTGRAARLGGSLSRPAGGPAQREAPCRIIGPMRVGSEGYRRAVPVCACGKARLRAALRWECNPVDPLMLRKVRCTLCQAVRVAKFAPVRSVATRCAALQRRVLRWHRCAPVLPPCSAVLQLSMSRARCATLLLADLAPSHASTPVRQTNEQTNPLFCLSASRASDVGAPAALLIGATGRFGARMWHIACCMLHVACCTLHVARYMLHVTCCMVGQRRRPWRSLRCRRGSRRCTCSRSAARCCPSRTRSSVSSRHPP